MLKTYRPSTISKGTLANCRGSSSSSSTRDEVVHWFHWWMMHYSRPRALRLLMLSFEAAVVHSICSRCLPSISLLTSTLSPPIHSQLGTICIYEFPSASMTRRHFFLLSAPLIHNAILPSATKYSKFFAILRLRLIVAGSPHSESRDHRSSENFSIHCSSHCGAPTFSRLPF